MTRQKIEWKRHQAGVYGDVSASGRTRSYRIVRDVVPGSWLIEVYAVKVIGGDTFRDVSRPVLDTMHADTLALAKAVAGQYDALGDDYQPHEHGDRARRTEAITRAYDADKAQA